MEMLQHCGDIIIRACQIWAKFQRAMQEGFNATMPCYLGMEELVDIDQPGVHTYE